MQKIALILTTLMLLTAIPVVSAHDEDKDREREREELRLEVRSHNENGDEEENEFEIKGEIESVGENSFVVNGQTILIDITQVGKFKQKGILKVGVMVKVEGVIINGNYYAAEIMTIGTGQGRFQIIIKELFPHCKPIRRPWIFRWQRCVKGLFTPSSPFPSPTPSASPTPESTPTVSPSPSVSPTPTATPIVEVKVKAVGPIELVISFLEQVLAYLQGLIS
ncbi:MAG: DUF5666 domain-containing protein [Patescibacteria group bacterium]